MPRDEHGNIKTPGHILIEASALSALLASPAELMDTAIEMLEPSDFAFPNHIEIYKALLHLHASKKPIELATLHDELEKRETLIIAGGFSYLVDLNTRDLQASDFASYAGDVREKARRREVLAVAQEMWDGGMNEDSGESLDIIAKAEAKLAAILTRDAQSRGIMQPLPHFINRVTNNINDRYHRKDGEIAGIPTGFATLDAVTGGWQKTDLILVAGVPSMGKTAVAIQMGVYPTFHGYRTAVFSQEMSGDLLTERIMCSEARVPISHARSGRLTDIEWERLSAAGDRLWNNFFSIGEQTSLTVADIRAQVRRLVMNGGIDLVVIDYFGQIDYEVPKMPTHEAAASAVKAIKRIAREFQVPIMLVCQIGREVGKREDKRPMLSDLAETRKLEAEADVILFPFRPQYYEKKQSLAGAAIDPSGEEMELIIAKQRNGATGAIDLVFHPAIGRFEEKERGPF